MIRTQVYLTTQLYQSIQRLAGKEDKPAARIIRELLQAGLQEKKQITAKEGLLEILKIGKKVNAKGPKDLSKNIDKYLYEEYE